MTLRDVLLLSDRRPIFIMSMIRDKIHGPHCLSLVVSHDPRFTPHTANSISRVRSQLNTYGNIQLRLAMNNVWQDTWVLLRILVLAAIEHHAKWNIGLGLVGEYEVTLSDYVDMVGRDFTISPCIQFQFKRLRYHDVNAICYSFYL